MQLRLRPRHSRSLINITRGFFIKAILLLLILFLAIFLLDKIDVSAPSKVIKQEISNDKLITIK
tara:strand:+ start:367 stop:558 length:192 start_codon:yes stop_codon:yes gene_type:complete